MQGLISSAEIVEHDVILPDQNQSDQTISASSSGVAAAPSTHPSASCMSQWLEKLTECVLYIEIPVPLPTQRLIVYLLGVCAGSNTFLSAGSWSAAHAPNHMAEKRSSHDVKGPAEASKPDKWTLYERGVPSDLFTLILQGKALIYTGDHIPDGHNRLY